MAKTELSRLAIVDRALEIADSEGIGAITIRRIATDFGVTPMALYWHVKNKDELLAAMGDRFFDDLDVKTDGSWDEMLTHNVNAIVDALRVHPGSAHLAPARILVCDAGRDLAEFTLESLMNQGFSIGQACDISRMAMQTATMLVCDEAGAELALPADERAAAVEAKRRSMAELDADRYPNLVASADRMTMVADPEAYYRFGVDLFISGVRDLTEPVSVR